MIKNRIIKIGTMVGFSIVGFPSLNWGVITQSELDQNIRALYKHEKADELMKLLRDQDCEGFKTKAQELQLTWWSEHIDKLPRVFLRFMEGMELVKEGESLLDLFNPAGAIESRGPLFWSEIHKFLSQLIDKKIKNKETSFPEDLSSFLDQLNSLDVQFNKLPDFMYLLESKGEGAGRFFIESMNNLILATIDKKRENEFLKQSMEFIVMAHDFQKG